MVEYLKKILSYLSSFIKHLFPIFSFIFLLMLIFWFARDILPKTQTYGQILVDSPEIYTRERLVNDRFIQDSWLKAFLEKEKYNEQKSFSKQVLNTQMGHETRKKLNTDNKELLEKLFKNSASTESHLIDEFDYRDRIRNLIIENQLDDRHDLNGNSLYRLKFDTTIMPGNRTSANAWIEIKLKSSYTAPDSNFTKEALKPWRDIYKKWLSNLESRLNQTHTELIDSYTNNEFKDSDYKEFIRFMVVYNEIEDKNISSIKDCSFVSSSSADTQYSIEHKRYKDCINSIATHFKKKSITESAKKKKEQKEKLEDIYRGKQKKQKEKLEDIYREKKKKQKEKLDLLELNTSISDLNTSISDLNASISDLNASISGQYGNENQYLSKQSGISTLDVIYPRTNSRETKLQMIERNLNVFMHINTLKLVFGIKMPTEEIKKTLKLKKKANIYFPQLENLSKISVFDPNLSDRNQNIYQVTEKFNSFITQEQNCTQKGYSTLIPKKLNITSESNRSLYMKEHEAKQLNMIGAELTTSDLNISINPFIKLEKYESNMANKCYTLGIESGLMRFILNALQHTNTYTYAITPKMRANNQIFSSNRTQAFDVNSSLLNTLLSLERRSSIQTLNRKGTTVGYGKAGDEHEAVFGWFIGPQLALAQNSMMVHTPQQLSLSALLAVPSWWDKGILEVTTKWIDEDGTARKNNETIKYKIDFPLDFKQLETKILDQIHLGPDLYDAAQEPINLIACQPGTILIRGKRLWRSTMVTLGTQSADQILVLPNMKGIIAKFDKIVNPISIAEEKEWSKEKNKDTNYTTIQRRVRVWTSQGTISLPHLAEIGVYQECHQQRIKNINSTVKGDHE